MSSLSKNYGYNIIGLFTGVLFPFLIFPYVSRILMPEYLGKITFVQSISNYFLTFALFGIPVYGIRELSRARVSEEKEKVFSKTFTELFLISIVGSFISAILMMIFIFLYAKNLDIENLIFIYLFQIIFAFLNLDYVFISLENHKRRTIRTTLLRVVSLMLIFIFVKTTKDYIFYGIILVFPELLIRFIDFYFCKEYIYKNLKELNLKKHIKPLSVIFLYVFSVGIYINLDATMLGFLRTNREVGLYTTGSKLVKMVIPIISVLGTVMAPRIIGYIKLKNKEKIYETMDSFIDFNIILGIPATVLMFYLAKDIILVISGDRFIESVLTMKIISFVIIFLPIGTFFGGQILLPNDKESIVFKVAVTGMISNILLNFLMIPKYGIEGAAFATVFTETLICLYRGYQVKKIYSDYRFITKERINYFISGMISSGILTLLNNFKTEKRIYNILFFASIYTCTYFGILIILKDKNLIIIVRKIINQLKKISYLKKFEYKN